MKKNILISICNRTNFTKLYPVLKELKKSKKINLKIILSSTIANTRYSDAFNDIKRRRFKINEYFESSMLNTTHEAMSNNLSLSIVKHADYLKKTKIHLYLSVGDRFDALPAYITCLIENIPIVHIQGGEKSGSIDNIIRSIISIGSNLHFPATVLSKKNLENIGINKKSIFNYGCPAVEYISKIKVGKYLDVKKLKKKFRNKIFINSKSNYSVVILHPNTTSSKDVDIMQIIQAILECQLKIIIFYPNLDANSSTIEKYFNDLKKNKNIVFIKHAPVEDFTKLIAHSKIVIGNSSAGIREAASFGIPVINIGNRQINRERNKNTFDCSTNKEKLKNLINKLKNKKFKKKNIYYKNNSAKNISKKIIEFIKTNAKKY